MSGSTASARGAAASASAAAASASEIQTIVAARALAGVRSCFIGVGRPSTAAILARMVHNPELELFYESGTIGAKPYRVPLSIGDSELASTATAVVSVLEMFNYWVQAGRIEVAFLGAAQIDRFANINTTVIGSYDKPKVRLPGAGGAPEIATAAGEVFIMLRQSNRAFVDKLDFVNSVGFLDVGEARAKLGISTKGPTKVITDLGILEPDPLTKELTLTHLHPGVSVDQAKAATGWPLAVADRLATTEAPTPRELVTLRDLHARTARAHAGNA